MARKKRIIDSRKKRINLEIGDRHTEELNWLMNRWGLDMTNTIRLMISNTVRAERKKDEPGRAD